MPQAHGGDVSRAHPADVEWSAELRKWVFKNKEEAARYFAEQDLRAAEELDRAMALYSAHAMSDQENDEWTDDEREDLALRLLWATEEGYSLVLEVDICGYPWILHTYGASGEPLGGFPIRPGSPSLRKRRARERTKEQARLDREQGVASASRKSAERARERTRSRRDLARKGAFMGGRKWDDMQDSLLVACHRFGEPNLLIALRLGRTMSGVSRRKAILRREGLL